MLLHIVSQTLERKDCAIYKKWMPSELTKLTVSK